MATNDQDMVTLTTGKEMRKDIVDKIMLILERMERGSEYAVLYTLAQVVNHPIAHDGRISPEVGYRLVQAGFLRVSTATKLTSLDDDVAEVAKAAIVLGEEGRVYMTQLVPPYEGYRTLSAVERVRQAG